MKGTFYKCLMVTSQLKLLTFVRLCLITSFGGPSLAVALVSSSDGVPSLLVTFEFYVSALADLAAQYINALGTNGSLLIT